MEYSISRFEEQGDSLFICINSDDNPVYLEHFFTEEEKADIKGTIERLVAELELMDEAYIAPPLMVSRLEEARLIKVEPANIQLKKDAIIFEKAEELRIEEEKLQSIEDVGKVEPTESLDKTLV